jgi:hypothetical protein
MKLRDKKFRSTRYGGFRLKPNDSVITKENTGTRQRNEVGEKILY